MDKMLLAKLYAAIPVVIMYPKERGITNLPNILRLTHFLWRAASSKYEADLQLRLIDLELCEYTRYTK
jgi:hypothetical protein